MARQEFPIAFGKVRYEPGVPRSLPRWVWMCECAKCQPLDPNDRLHGPFKTLREAERDAESTIKLIVAEPGGSA